MFTTEGGRSSVDYNTSRESLRAEAVSKMMRSPKKPRTNTVFPRDPEPDEAEVGRYRTPNMPGQAPDPGSLIGPAMDNLIGPGTIGGRMGAGLQQGSDMLDQSMTSWPMGQVPGGAGMFGGLPGLGSDEDYLSSVAPQFDTGLGQQVDPTILMYILRQLAQARGGQTPGGMVPGNHNRPQMY